MSKIEHLRYLIMGVINITPDSFSDGGDFFTPANAVARAQELLHDGADLIDLGAESTRPGSKPLNDHEEWERLEPVLKELRTLGLVNRLSLDSRHASNILRACKTYGLLWANNIEGLYPADCLRELAKIPDLRYIAMHKHGDPETMQYQPLKGSDAVRAVGETFEHYTHELLSSGFTKERIYMDPGIGFGKDDTANFSLMSETAGFVRKFQVAIGISRKSFLGRNFGIEDPKQRDDVSKAFELSLFMMGAHIVRTHSVARLRKMRDLWLEGKPN